MKNQELIVAFLALALVKLSNRRARIGAIYSNIPELFECTDGTYTSSSGKRGCVRHGGKKTGLPLNFGNSGSSLLEIQDIPLSQIIIDRKLFQGREKAFSQRSVDNILADVENGRFVWENLDPITLWRSPDNQLFLLSGHSRLKAFEILADASLKVDGKSFNRIPAKVRSGSLEGAQRLALESNTLSTKETDTERAAYYRRLRQDGTEEKSLLQMVKKNEGKNWVNVYAYTFLSPSGSSWATLKQFADGEDTSSTMAKSLIKWIGNGRRIFPMLTNEHENELYQWIFENKGYGTAAGQVANERNFLEKLEMVIQKNTVFGEFDPSKPLNILAAQQKSPVEIQYEMQVQELNRDILEIDRQLKAKIKTLAQQRATAEQVRQIVAPFEAALRTKRAELARLLQKRSEITEYSKNEPQLFGIRGFKRFRFFHHQNT